jgi:hypothetical protein
MFEASQLRVGRSTPLFWFEFARWRAMRGRLSRYSVAAGLFAGAFLFGATTASATALAGGSTASVMPFEQAVASDQVAAPATGAAGSSLTAPDDEGQDSAPAEQDVSRPNIDPNAPPPTVEYDLAKLPDPVRELRERIIAAAKTGSIEALKPLLGSGSTGTDVGGDSGSDPIAFLRSLSGDNDGREILAILIDILDSGYVHLNAGKPNEIYAWPYFFAYPIGKLTPPQMVELFRIMTAGDFEDMKSYGAYIFYRVGITPDGHWRFFVAGE